MAFYKQFMYRNTEVRIIKVQEHRLVLVSRLVIKGKRDMFH